MFFSKMHGCGNDYVYVNCLVQTIDNPSECARKVSDRHFGIGSDGLILIKKSDVADFKMQMFNGDGSEAEMCGNGIRCVGKYVYEKNLTNNTTVTVETLAGVKTLLLNIKDGIVDTVTVDMGEPVLNPLLIPVIADENPVLDLPLSVLDSTFTFSCISMGNPHAVTYVDDVSNFDVAKYGAVVEIHRRFPKKTNVEFVEIIDRQNLKMRVWERGSGETLACGTGTCAIVVASVLNNFCDRQCNVKVLGGQTFIDWSEADNHVYLTGPAEFVFDGELLI